MAVKRRSVKQPPDPAPEPRAPEARPAPGVLPIALRVGDRFTDQAGEWEVVSRPQTTAGGKMVHVRVRRVGEPAATEERSWPARRAAGVRHLTTIQSQD